MYPIKYNMDEFYFRIKRTSGYETVCLSDMTIAERAYVLKNYAEGNLEVIIDGLCEALREIGDRYGFIANDADRLEDRSEL